MDQKQNAHVETVVSKHMSQVHQALYKKPYWYDKPQTQMFRREYRLIVHQLVQPALGQNIISPGQELMLYHRLETLISRIRRKKFIVTQGILLHELRPLSEIILHQETSSINRFKLFEEQLCFYLSKTNSSSTKELNSKKKRRQ